MPLRIFEVGVVGFAPLSPPGDSTKVHPAAGETTTPGTVEEGVVHVVIGIEDATARQHPRELAGQALERRQVMEDGEAGDDVEAAVRERQLLDVGGGGAVEGRTVERQDPRAEGRWRRRGRGRAPSGRRPPGG